MNLFTADMKAIDEQLPQSVAAAMSLLFLMVVTVIMVVTILPIALIPLVPLFVVYMLVQNVYRNSARELKRFDSTTQSPIFNHFTESIAGLSTIRAFRCEERMMRETTARIDYNSRVWTKNNFANRWLGLRLDFIGAGPRTLGFACVIAIRAGGGACGGLDATGGLVLTTRAR